MQSISLSQEFTLVGLGAASGIVVLAEKIFLISDSSNALYRCDLNGHNLEVIALSDNGLPNIPKKLKPDFEALTIHDEKLYLFGSGSTENRNMLAIVNAESFNITKFDVSSLYSKMKRIADIDNENFNIEGVVFNKDWYFFQRGNGQMSKNGIFTVSEILGDNPLVSYTSVTLPQIKGVAYTFTDAVLAGKAIWFLATAEDSRSVYDDGQILGSVIGKIDPGTMKLLEIKTISDTHKFEGICCLEENETEIVFLLCEDNDTEALQSSIYRLTVTQG